MGGLFAAEYDFYKMFQETKTKMQIVVIHD